MADFNLRALQVTEGENLVVSDESDENAAALKIEDPDAGGNYNIKVRVAAAGEASAIKAYFVTPIAPIAANTLVDDVGNNLVDALGGNVLKG